MKIGLSSTPRRVKVQSFGVLYTVGNYGVYKGSIRQRETIFRHKGIIMCVFCNQAITLNMGLRDLGNSGLYMSDLLEKYLFPFFSLFLSVHVARCQFKIH